MSQGGGVDGCSAADRYQEEAPRRRARQNECVLGFRAMRWACVAAGPSKGDATNTILRWRTRYPRRPVDGPSARASRVQEDERGVVETAAGRFSSHGGKSKGDAEERTYVGRETSFRQRTSSVSMRMSRGRQTRGRIQGKGGVGVEAMHWRRRPGQLLVLPSVQASTAERT